MTEQSFPSAINRPANFPTNHASVAHFAKTGVTAPSGEYDESSIPAFSVKTVHTVKPVLPLLHLTDRQDPLYWAKDDFELAGSGRRLTLTFQGSGRFAAAQSAWDAIVSSSTIDDEVSLNGTGLVAFTSFAFSDHSAESSVLIFSETLYGRIGDQYFESRLKLAPSSTTMFDAPITAPDERTVTEALSVLRSDSDSADEFRKGVQKLTELISNGIVEKAVLARTVTRTLSTNFDPRNALNTLRSNYPNCWTFRVNQLFGASPETLFEIHDGDYSLRVLAGSAPRGNTPEADSANRDDLFHSTKNQNEHDFAVESGINALEPLSRTLTKTDTFMLPLKNLWHLATDLTGTLAHGHYPLDVLATLHPTAAVAGTPRSKALDVIKEVEGFDRGRYAGPVGWMNNAGDGQWAIALRCAKQHGTHVVAYAGCGIVTGSDPESELQETDLKLAPILGSITNA